MEMKAIFVDIDYPCLDPQSIPFVYFLKVELVVFNQKDRTTATGTVLGIESDFILKGVDGMAEDQAIVCILHVVIVIDPI